MPRKSNNSRIYGLTVKQWTTLAVIVVALVVGAYQFCRNQIVQRVPQPDANQIANANRPKKREPRQSKPTNALSPAEATARYLKFGNPSNAAQADANNFLIVKSDYALSYNRLRNTANWAAWTVTEADLGAVDRANDFRPDTTLPNGFYRVTPNDYVGTGYDRGHLCPSADRTASPEANSQTFLMTNMVPQTPDLNREVWESLESESRQIVRQGNDVYTVAGVRGEIGKLKGKITVPAFYWKIVLVAPDGFDQNITENARIIAVEMPNQNGIKGNNWRKYRTTVRDLEQKTGLNFFSNLPANVQNVLETRQDSN